MNAFCTFIFMFCLINSYYSLFQFLKNLSLFFIRLDPSGNKPPVVPKTLVPRFVQIIDHIDICMHVYDLGMVLNKIIIDVQIHKLFQPILLMVMIYLMQLTQDFQHQQFVQMLHRQQIIIDHVHPLLDHFNHIVVLKQSIIIIILKLRQQFKKIVKSQPMT